jgi:hypothetical protein
MTDRGTVEFSVPSLPSEAGRLVKVRDAELKIVDRVQPGARLELDEGLYLASVLLPSGEEDEQAIRVTAGGFEEVRLGPEEASFCEDYTLEADLPRSLVFNAGTFEATSSSAPREWFARVVSAGAQVAPMPALELVASTAEPAAGVADLVCRGTPDAGALLWAQVAVPGQVPFVCALPMLPGHPEATCRLRVVATTDAIRVTALPTGSPMVEAVVAYLVTGNPGHAAEVASQAVELMQGKVDDPVAAALGAYALLRLGRLDEVRDWVANLADWFPDMPDGAILAAELAARAGDRDDLWLPEAVSRGVPMFADGLSLLATRLRAGEREDPSRLLEIATLADFAQLVVAYPAAEPEAPAASQHPVEDFDPSAGWLRFEGG